MNIDKIVDEVIKITGHTSAESEHLRKSFADDGYVDVLVADDEALRRLKIELQKFDDVIIDSEPTTDSLLDGMPFLGGNIISIGPKHSVKIYLKTSKKFLFIDLGNWTLDGKRMPDICIKVPRSVRLEDVWKDIKKEYAKQEGIDIEQIPDELPATVHEIPPSEYDTYRVKIDYT